MWFIVWFIPWYQKVWVSFVQWNITSKNIMETLGYLYIFEIILIPSVVLYLYIRYIWLYKCINKIALKIWYKILYSIFTVCHIIHTRHVCKMREMRKIAGIWQISYTNEFHSRYSQPQIEPSVSCTNYNNSTPLFYLKNE